MKQDFNEKTNLFTKKGIKSYYQNGLVAVRNALTPLVYDDSMLKRSQEKRAAVLGGALGLSLSACVATAGYALGQIGTPVEVATGLLGATASLAVAGFGKNMVDKNLGEKPDSKIIKGVLNKIDVYLYKNCPDLYEQSEEQIKTKVSEIKAKENNTKDEILKKQIERRAGR